MDGVHADGCVVGSMVIENENRPGSLSMASTCALIQLEDSGQLKKELVHPVFVEALGLLEEELARDGVTDCTDNTAGEPLWRPDLQNWLLTSRPSLHTSRPRLELALIYVDDRLFTLQQAGEPPCEINPGLSEPCV